MTRQEFDLLVRRVLVFERIRTSTKAP